MSYKASFLSGCAFHLQHHELFLLGFNHLAFKIWKMGQILLQDDYIIP